MPSLLACFPVCMTLAALGVLILFVLATEALRRGELPTETDAAGAEAQARPNLPPVWVIVSMFAGVLILLFVLSRIWPE